MLYYFRLFSALWGPHVRFSVAPDGFFWLHLIVRQIENSSRTHWDSTLLVENASLNILLHPYGLSGCFITAYVTAKASLKCLLSEKSIWISTKIPKQGCQVGEPKVESFPRNETAYQQAKQPLRKGYAGILHINAWEKVPFNVMGLISVQMLRGLPC